MKSDDWKPNFSWIRPDLAVGGRFPEEHAAALASLHGLGAVIDLRAEDCDNAAVLDACGIRFLHLPTQDECGVSQIMLDEAVSFAAAAARERVKLLIHCEHGIGRSALVALCVLSARNLAPMEALASLKEARAEISPSRAQYGAWREWLERNGKQAPSYEAFGMIAYRHLVSG